MVATLLVAASTSMVVVVHIVPMCLLRIVTNLALHDVGVARITVLVAP